MQKEFERKAALTAEEFEATKKSLDKIAKGHTFIQENRYYDTEDFSLKRSSRTLRIRKIGDSLVREHKHGRSSVGDVRICIEDNVKIDGIPPFIKGSEIGESEDTVYFPLGVLVTERTEYVIDGACIALDKSTYLGIVDYEIEVEMGGVSPLPSALLALNIDFGKAVIGKYHRFVKRLLKLKNITN